MQRRVSRRAMSLCLAGAVAVVFMAFAIHWSMTPLTVPHREAVSIVALPGGSSNGGRAVAVSPVDSDRGAVDLADMSEVIVKNGAGQLLDAEAVAQDRRYTIRGSGWIPKASGTVTVSSVGYAPASVKLDEAKIDVVLHPAFRVEGAIFDAATKARVPGVPISLEPRLAGGPPIVCKTNGAGEFKFETVPKGLYVLRGEPTGYVPLCSGLSAISSGISVDVSENVHVEVPTYPVYVALCGIHNQTNLADVVFGALISCGFSQQPGLNLPQWFDRDVVVTISDAARALGILHPYGQACCLEVPSETLDGQVDFVFDGDSVAISKKVVFQPLAEFLRNPVVTWHTIERTFALGALTVESPITLRICEGSGVVFGGVETTPGSFTVELPHGTYVVGPLDMNPMLQPEQWTRTVSIPSQGKVTIAPAAGFATLELTGGSEWPRGVLCCKGQGFSMGLPVKNLPNTMPVSPGTYEFVVLLESGSQDPPVWKGAITLEAGQRMVMKVGNN